MGRCLKPPSSLISSPVGVHLPSVFWSHLWSGATRGSPTEAAWGMSGGPGGFSFFPSRRSPGPEWAGGAGGPDTLGKGHPGGRVRNQGLADSACVWPGGGPRSTLGSLSFPGGYCGRAGWPCLLPSQDLGGLSLRFLWAAKHHTPRGIAVGRDGGLLTPCPGSGLSAPGAVGVRGGRLRG